MRVARSALRTSFLLLAVCLVFIGGDPRGGLMQVGAAASSSATVQVEYKGSWTATFSQTNYPNDGRGKREQKWLARISVGTSWPACSVPRDGDAAACGRIGTHSYIFKGASRCATFVCSSAR